MTAAQDERFEHILLERKDDGTAVITLNRPDSRNAMNSRAQTELIEALDRCRTDTRAIVLTGAGPAFCAGVDLKERRQAIQIPGPAYHGDSWTEANMALYEHPAICIAAVNGHALGGGMTLINSCDLAIAADEATLGMPEVTFGAYPAYAGPSTQLRTLPKTAAWLILTAERIDGKRAVELGIVNKSVPLADLMTTATRLASDVATRDPATLDWCKKATHQVPTVIQDYRSALEYGPTVTQQIRARTQAYAASLETFEKSGVGNSQASQVATASKGDDDA